MAVKPAKYAQIYASGSLVPSVWGGGNVRVISDIITLKSQAIDDTIPLGVPLPKGARILYGMLVSSKSLGSSKFKIGFQDDPDDLRSSVNFSRAETPQFFAELSDDPDPILQDKQLILDVDNANFPSSGTLLFHLFYVSD